MITNVQLYLVVGLPMILVLASLTVSLVQISGIRTEMSSLREDTRSQIAGLREDTRSQIAGIRAEIGTLREDIREIRSDIKLLTGKVYELMSQKP